MYAYRNGFKFKLREKDPAWYNPKRWYRWLRGLFKK